MTRAPAIFIERLTLHDHHGRAFVADLDLELSRGESLVLAASPEIGNAVLRAVVGLKDPDKGRALLLGEEVRSLPRARAEALLARVGYVPRYGPLLSNLPLRENLALPLRWHKHLGADRAFSEAARAAECFGVSELPAQIPPLVKVELRRRLALARSVVLSPEVLVLDDPTEDLAPAAALDVARRLSRLAREMNAAVFIASHDPALTEALNAKTLNLSSN